MPQSTSEHATTEEELDKRLRDLLFQMRDQCESSQEQTA
jgi:hypothetical protein